MSRILIVEDEVKIARFVTLELQHEGYEVEAAHDGRTGLEMALEWKPDLMILDLMLPELDGISLLHTAAAEGIVPHVLGLTRFASDYVMESAERLGVSYLMMILKTHF